MINRMPAGLISRAPATRTTRADPRQRRMESLAAEFALLAQRRGRVVHQLDLLDQQREAAAAGLAKMQARMAWLTQRMDALDPDLRPDLRTGFETPPAPLLPAMQPAAAAAPAPRPLKPAVFAGHAPIVQAAPAAPVARQSAAPKRPRPPTRPYGSSNGSLTGPLNGSPGGSPGGSSGGRWRT